MCGSNRLSLPGKGLGGAPGPGGWAPRALGGLQVKRLVGRAPQLGDPWKACQRGGLLCVTPSPQGDPFAWGTCEGGGAPWAVGGGDPKCPALPWASKCSQGEGRRQPSSASPLTIHLGGTPSNRLSLSRPGWSRAAVAAGRGRAPAARGWQAVGGRAGPRAPGVGGAGGGALSRRSARACRYLHPAEACPGPAFPEPQAAGLCGGACAPLILAGAFCEVPPPCGPEAGPGRRGSFRPAPRPRDREGRVAFPDPAGRSKASLPQLPPRGPRLSPHVRMRPRTGSHHVFPWSWPPKSHPTPAICLGKPATRLPQGRSTGPQPCL